MIFGNLNHIEEYAFLEEALQKCFQYIKDHDVLSYETGRHDIQGDALFVNVVSYTTTTKENRFWEAHRQYLDVHIMLDGEEQIDVNFIQNLKQGTFEPENDFLPLEGDENSHVTLRKHDFVIFYPNDGHRTAVQVNEPCTIKKAIFKVQI